MGFTDAILEGLGNTVLSFAGIIVIIFGIGVIVVSAGANSTIGTIMGLVITVFGFALRRSEYKR